MTSKTLNILFASLGLSLASSHAAIVSLSPSDINGLDTTTTNFNNGEVSMTPFRGGLPVTFNGNATRLGIDGVGSNNNAFNDPNTTVGDADDESLEIVFQPSIGLTQLSWDFSRADGPGPNDGVLISGFTVDPGATIVFGGAGTRTGSVSYNAGVLQIDITGADFSGDIDLVNLSNPAASAGQTLVLTVNDTTQTGAQLAIRGFQYDNDVIPEPSSFALAALAGLGIALRRRR